MRAPTFDLERAHGAETGCLVAGVDEAGRGPWAGPVVAAAVILKPGQIPPGLGDSKKLSEARRTIAFDALVTSARIGVGIADVARIDRDNILNATYWAMAEAVGNLGAPAPDAVLVDGNRAPKLACKTETVVKGDARCLSIAAASIVAKVTRDRIMCDLARLEPRFGFEKHKGYGTKAHQEALAAHGPTRHHRRSFRPIQLALGLPPA